MGKKFRKISEVLAAMEQDPSLVDQVKRDPKRALEEISKGVYQDDKVFYRIVVFGLIVVALMALMFAGLADGTGPNQAVTAMGTVALGAIAGLLAPVKSD
ncbi:MAG: hypothetical protein VYC34_07160 [Planctomycetota bacterium]|nr:hypothetical protein [Planctomycetota bacterium]